MSDAAGTIGWWSDSKDVYAPGQAFVNGMAASGDRTLRIGVIGEETRLTGFLYVPQAAALLL